ncbi:MULTISPECIES: DUF2905 domain-containing protein [Desulfosediminicola]|uniref:DUF2905 domain-containing protein n=1 Tax=Desulfosediminicola TaxID=2886823 RepID=UPI001C3C8A3F|nr:DUF2905 domain-containing protein [Desulfosediminicola ganghwensis]
MNKNLITIGVIVIIIGLLWPWLQKIPFGRLPGDIVVNRDNFRFFMPITTCIVISVVISLILWWFRK